MSDMHPGKSGLFRLSDGRNMLATFALVTTLFLLWGFCNGLIDVLNKHFQSTLHITKYQSGFVQSANYLAYFLMAIPAGLLARRFGYKGGILIGLSLIVIGALWFVAATQFHTYAVFLAGLFILAAGMTCLETVANPYTTVLGSAEKSAARINIAQTFNGVGWILGPVIGGAFIFEGAKNADVNSGLYVPYLGIAIVVAVLLAIFAVSRVPDLQPEEAVEQAGGAARKGLWRTPHFLFGVLAQFMYVSAQSGIFAFFINYVMENQHVSDIVAKDWLGYFGFGLFMLGRLCGSAVVSWAKAHRVLTFYAVVNVVLCGVAMLGGNLGFAAVLGTFFFMSIMFPTIFALGIQGLGPHTKLGSSIIVMSIVGGAIAPPVMGHIADIMSMRVGFFVPMVCFAYIVVYGLIWPKLAGAK
ncbi:sugar MFS transporter [Rhizomicrobium electricum]|uniref:L-fucose:H+ symporter permease n=1 Tax=Rhizomicrobium electricum TaxID=480070 RepID=A0ABN1ELG4_9PROT|nr:sugar MFS transporter [Rhizomicrobium electricum]NIJ47170.1 FHS family L-fucose permease-like MFS transporter [Rhizomicrobium electricum]